MRVVLDTNVIVSALLSPLGIPNQIFRAWQLLRFDLLVSEKSIAELERVIHYPKILSRLGSTEEEIVRFVDFFYEKAIWITPQETVNAIQSDLSDNLYLEIAIAGNADYVVTGDQHLLELDEFRGIAIITPTQFLAFLESAD